MELKLEKQFSVAAPLERVWGDLLDTGGLVRSMPSDDVRRLDGENAYQAALTIGPRRMRGTLRPIDADEDERVASFLVEGREAGGAAVGAGMVRGRVTAVDGLTHVGLTADLKVAGLGAHG